MSGSTSSIEEPPTRRDETSSNSGILHRLGTFLEGLTSRCRRRVKRVRNQRKQRTRVSQKPGNSGEEDHINETRSTGICPQKEKSDEEGNISTEGHVENAQNIATCHQPEPKKPQSNLTKTEANVTQQYHHGQRGDNELSDDNVSVSEDMGKDNRSNIAGESTSPLFSDTPTSSELHQVLRKEENSKKSPQKLSSRISKSASISTTRPKTLTYKHYSSPSQGIQELSRNVLESLLTTKGSVVDDSYKWLVDSQKTQVTPLSAYGYQPHSHDISLVQSVQQPKDGTHQDNSTRRGSSIPLTLPDHTQFMESNKPETVLQISAWNTLPLHHKRTLNFSRNYVQGNNDDLQEIGLDLQSTVKEWCSQHDKSGIGSVVTNENPPIQDDTLGDSNEENFQPLLKLGLTDKPDIPQSRNTMSHTILERFNTSKHEKNDFETAELTTVEQWSNVGPVVSPQKVLSNNLKAEEMGIHRSGLSALKIQKQPVSTNSQPPDTTNSQPPEATDKLETENAQESEVTNGYKPNATNSLLATAKHQNIKTVNNDQLKATHVQQTKTTNSQQPETLNRQLQEATNIHVESADNLKQEATHRQQPETTHKQIHTGNEQQLEITYGQNPVTTNNQAEVTKPRHIATKATHIQQLKTIDQQPDTINGRQQHTAGGVKLMTTKCHQQGITNNTMSDTIYRQQKGINEQQSNQADKQQMRVIGLEPIGQINGQQKEQANSQLSEEISRKADVIKTMKHPAVNENRQFQSSNSDRVSVNQREMGKLDNVADQTNGEVYTYKNRMNNYADKKETLAEKNDYSSDTDSSNMDQYKFLNNTKFKKAGNDKDMALHSVDEYLTRINIPNTTNENSSKTLIPDDEVSKSKSVVGEQQRREPHVDEEVIYVQSSEGRTNDQLKNDTTDICESHLNQNTERESSITGRETNTCDQAPSMESTSKPYPPQTAFVKSDVSLKNEQRPVKVAKEHTMTQLTASKRQNDNSSPTEKPINLPTSANNIHDRQEMARESSFNPCDEKGREPNTYPTTEQRIHVKDTGIPEDSSTVDASLYGAKTSKYSTTKRVVINKSFFQKMKINETNEDMLKDDMDAATHSAEQPSDKKAVMSYKDQPKEKVEDTNLRWDICHPVLQNHWIMNYGFIKGDNQSGEQQGTNVNVETSNYNNKQNDTETSDQNGPGKPSSCDRKNGSYRGESDQTNHEIIEPNSKCDADSAKKLSDRQISREVLITVSLGNSELSESSAEETVCPRDVIPDTPFVESPQVQVQEQTSHVAQMKCLLDCVYDQTTIESDFSDDVSGEYCNHSEMTQDVNINNTLHASSRTDSSVTQRKDTPPEENVTLLNKRDKLMKPLLKNIKDTSKESLSKAVTDDNVDGKNQTENCILRNDEQHIVSMPNIQPPTVHGDNEIRPRVVIKYHRKPYPPEGRPLSASMGSFRFRKLQGVSGELEKAQSSNDIREDGNFVRETEHGTDQHKNDHRNWTGIQGPDDSTKISLPSPAGNHIDAFSRSGINPKPVSSSKTVGKPVSKVGAVMAKRIMNKRKTAAPPLLRFNSYKAEDDLHISYVIASNKRPSEAEGLINDSQTFDYLAEKTEQQYVTADTYGQKDLNSGVNTVGFSPNSGVNTVGFSPNSGVNTVGFSPRELAFAQKLSPGERKTMPSSNTENVSYPDLVSSNTTQHHADSPVPNQRGTLTKCTGNQRINALRKSLSGSAASDDFLEKARSERRVVLPSRFQRRSQKVATSSSTNQVQYGSSSDPRRRQQLENKLHGSTDRNRNRSPFSKSTDCSRVIQASKKIMTKRGTLNSTRMMNGNGEVADSSSERPEDEGVTHSGQPTYPIIGGRTSDATSVNHEHDSLLPNDQDVEQEYSDMGKSSDLLDSGGLINDLRKDLSHLQNLLDENESTNNMSGSKTSSTFLSTAISERRAIFPSRLRSKANNSTAGIGPPVLTSQGSTTGNLYLQTRSETSVQYKNDCVIPTESFEIKTEDDLSGINMAAERTGVNAIADSLQGNVTDSNEVQPTDSNHPKPTQRDMNSVTSESTVHHFESNKSSEGKINAANKHIQLPVPKPRETLVPSNFPINKHRLPIVHNPLRETVARPMKAPTTSRIATPTPLVTAVIEDSVEGNEIVKPIIRKPPMEPIPAVSKKIKNFRSRQKMVLTGRLHQKSEENLKFFKQISKTTDFYKDRTRNVQ